MNDKNISQMAIEVVFAGIFVELLIICNKLYLRHGLEQDPVGHQTEIYPAMVYCFTLCFLCITCYIPQYTFEQHLLLHMDGRE